MANPTGWKPSMEPQAGGSGAAEVGAGGATRGLAYEEPLLCAATELHTPELIRLFARSVRG